MRLWKYSLMVCALASCSACIKVAHLYDLDRPVVLTASFRVKGTGHGPIIVTDSNGAACQGEYNTVAGGSTGWGAIYSGTTITQGIVATTSNEQHGAAVASCPDGRVYECEYVTSASGSGGHGACRDNESHRYRLMF